MNELEVKLIALIESESLTPQQLQFILNAAMLMVKNGLTEQEVLALYQTSFGAN